ncbi:hypothetical protein PVAP13_1NG196719, partial [Panicum virgatum]
MPPEILWLIVGDFNLIRLPEDRNRPGGDVNEMLHFNEAISALGLIDLILKGRRFTWSNKQNPPLLERLDWFFTSNSWTSLFPDSSVSTLNMETSDHVPCLVSIGTNIPKSAIFRFENYLMEHENFMTVVQHGWSIPVYHTDVAKKITAKFKNLRRVIKAWQSHLSSLKDNISNVKITLELLCMIEEFRDLTLLEWNFKSLLEDKLLSLLKQHRIYWKQRCTIKWVKE